MRRSLALALVLPLVLAGCGGNGGGTLSARARTVGAVDEILDHVSDLTHYMPLDRAQKTSRLPGLPKALAKLDASRSVGRAEAPYYDSRSKLWVVEEENTDEEVVSSLHFFSDKALTKPAGYSLFSRNTEEDPSWMRIESEYLAGAYAGTRFSYYTESSRDGSQRVDIASHYKGISQFTLQGSSASDGSGSFTQSFNLADGRSETDVLTLNADGTSRIAIDASTSLAATFEFTPDGSGEGTITGPQDGLPATLVWDTDGTGRITWADGTTKSFEAWEF